MVIVTGANGFIGSAFVGTLNAKKIPVLCVTDPVDFKQRPALLAGKSYGQLLAPDELWNFIEKPEVIEKVTWVVHMGANSSTTETNWEHLYSNNFLCSQKIFDWCTRNRKNLIYASSAATYGQGELGFSDSIDSSKLVPLNLYGKSKLIFDQWVETQKEVPPNFYGLKFFNVYGPNEYFKNDMASMVFKTFNQVKKTGKLNLFKSYNPQYKDGEFVRDFVYIKDVTRWMLELIEKKPKSGIYNMGTGVAQSWNSLGHALFSALKIPTNIEYIPMPESIRSQYQYFTEADMKKWKAAGLTLAHFSIESGVADYTRYLNNNLEVL